MDLRTRIEDLTNTANRRVWRAAVRYTPQGGSPTTETPLGDTLYGVFDSAHLVTVELDGMQVNDVRPVIEFVDDDLAAPPTRGALVELLSGRHAGEVFTVLEPHEDAAGAVMCELVAGTHA